MTQFPPIDALVPHRAPMILLDAVEDEIPEGVICRVTLREDSPFMENGVQPAVCAIEYMAQCVAVYAGLKARKGGDPVKIGYLIGARTVALHVERFDLGDTLLVRVIRVWGDSALGTFDATVERAGEVVATASLNVYQAPATLLSSPTEMPT
jgi:predicted hotdog family 3-hydroxylacyl-ACP dehydratase